MKPIGIDHLVLTVASIEATVRFYCDILGFEELTFGNGRRAVRCQTQKINLHQVGFELEPHAVSPKVGSGDLCLVYEGDLASIINYLESRNIPIEEGPVDRSGALGAIVSVYVRDPDGNLVELSVYKDHL